MALGERIIEVFQTLRAELGDDELGKRLGLVRRLLDAHDLTIKSRQTRRGAKSLATSWGVRRGRVVLLATNAVVVSVEAVDVRTGYIHRA